MSTPRPESRLSELESKMAIQDARIRELADDTAEELRAIRQDIHTGFSEVKQELKKMTSFEEVDAYLKHVATKDDITKVETRLERIEATMATKDDITSVKSDITDVKSDISKLESDITSIKTTQEQILKLLQQKPDTRG